MRKSLLANPEPLAVSPAGAGIMLRCGLTRIHKLLRTGQLDSYLEGTARRITVASIHAYIARKLAAGEAPARKPGRPRKLPEGRQ